MDMLGLEDHVHDLASCITYDNGVWEHALLLMASLIVDVVERDPLWGCKDKLRFRLVHGSYNARCEFWDLLWVIRVTVDSTN